MTYQYSFVTSRMEELSLKFMAAGLEAFLEEQVSREATLLEVISELINLELIPRKQRMARTRLKVFNIPGTKTREEFDLSWLKGELRGKHMAVYL